MYARFGLPDEDRDWESYFYGNEIEYPSHKTYSFNSGDSKEDTKVDLCEGNEEMVLIQDLKATQISEHINSTSTFSIKKPSKQEDNRVFHFKITSKRFNSGRYLIEENEKGFFIVNTRTLNRMLLTQTKTIHGGSIIVTKDPDKKSFTIIKTLSTSTVHTALSRIIGTLHIEGLLLKFTALDKSKTNVTVTV